MTITNNKLLNFLKQHKLIIIIIIIIIICVSVYFYYNNKNDNNNNNDNNIDVYKYYYDLGKFNEHPNNRHFNKFLKKSNNKDELLKHAYKNNIDIFLLRHLYKDNIYELYVHSIPFDLTFNKYGTISRYLNDINNIYIKRTKIYDLIDLKSNNIACYDINNNLIITTNEKEKNKCKLTCLLNDNKTVKTDIYNNIIDKCVKTSHNDKILCKINNYNAYVHPKLCGKYSFTCLDQSNNPITIDNSDPDFINKIYNNCIINNKISCSNDSNNYININLSPSDNINLSPSDNIDINLLLYKMFTDKHNDVINKCIKTTDTNIKCLDKNNTNNIIGVSLDDTNTITKCHYGYDMILKDNNEKINFIK